MKFSYNWLSELVPGLGEGPRDVARLITQKIAESEGVEEFAPWLAAVTPARIESVEPMADGHNRKAIVDAGPKYGKRQVVCGAPNCRVGVVTAYVPAGTVIAGGKTIGKAVIHGVESDGMLASTAELGINRDHAGIVELGSLDGVRPDWVVEVDNKSLNHRPDLWGHHGLARELSACTGRELKDPVDLSLLPAGGNEWSVEIENYGLCPRYSALVFENVTVGPSPLWLQARLEAVGLNSISNIVDVTNFVMAELAQPMHAFDADKLKGRTIFVRCARENEACPALNGETYTLQPSNLVIADAGGAIAVAGVIGGAGSAISEATTRLVLESANFNAASVRKTSGALKLRTDASMRFEKAQDPVNTLRGLARAVELLKLVSPGIRLVGGVVDNYRAPAPREPITLPLDWLEKKLGRALEPGEAARILRSLEFGVDDSDPRVLRVTVPSWRATKDVTIKDDLLEEVGRMVGYDSVPPQPPMQRAERAWVNQARLFDHQVRDMAAAQGFTETYNYSFVSEEMARRFGFDPEAHVHVSNPISVEQSLMRMSLLPGMHRNIVENAKRFESFRLFEIGSEIHKRAGELPDEIPHLMAALYAKDDGRAGLLELKRLAECLMPGCTVTPAPPRAYEHPARAAVVAWRGAELGRLYELHPGHVETGRAAILDIDLRLMMEHSAAPVKYRAIQRYPSSAYDLSVVTGVRTLIADVEREIAQAVRADAVAYLYSYRGEPLPDDKQSLTFRITISAADHTLTNDEVTASRNAAIAALQAAGFDLRM